MTHIPASMRHELRDCRAGNATHWPRWITVDPGKRQESQGVRPNVPTKSNRLASGFRLRYSIMFPFSYQGNTGQKLETVVDIP